MVGSELNIFSNNLWRIYTQAYGDLLESPQDDIIFAHLGIIV